jgi:hypothetical protein
MIILSRILKQDLKMTILTEWLNEIHLQFYIVSAARKQLKNPKILIFESQAASCILSLLFLHAILSVAVTQFVV